jgi:hypothetical protein
MRLVSLLLTVTSLAASSAAPQQQTPRPEADCHEWHECRTMALDACARRDYERFHDLAGRAVQTGPPRDPQLLYLLARAQSLSGRPDDAMVMLRRIMQMGVATDAATSDDFEAVRKQPEWPAIKAEILVLVALTPPARLAMSGGAPATALPLARPLLVSETALRLPATLIAPMGLAYDHVSGRFLLADRETRKLVSVDELSRHMVDLVEAGSAGFFSITAFEIDPRRGDLWVVSATDEATDHDKATALHKLQLVSGRPLDTFTLPDQFGPTRFTDVAISASGVVYVLDAEGRRIFRLRPRSRALTLACTLRLDQPASLAPVNDRTVFVAFAGGLARVDMTSGHAVMVQGPKNVPVSGLERIRWDAGRLVATEGPPGGISRVVTIRLAGTPPRVTSVDTLDTGGQAAYATATALSGKDIYFLTREPGRDGQDGEFVVRRTRVQ